MFFFIFSMFWIISFFVACYGMRWEFYMHKSVFTILIWNEATKVNVGYN